MYYLYYLDVWNERSVVPFTTGKKHKGEVGRGKSYKGKKKESKAVKILGRRSTLSDAKRSFLVTICLKYSNQEEIGTERYKLPNKTIRPIFKIELWSKPMNYWLRLYMITILALLNRWKYFFSHTHKWTKESVNKQHDTVQYIFLSTISFLDNF